MNFMQIQQESSSLSRRKTKQFLNPTAYYQIFENGQRAFA